MTLRIVIATHPRYKHWLRNILDTLNYKEHLDKIIISVSDVPQDQNKTVRKQYKKEFGITHVFTYHTNIDEFTSFVSIGKVISEGIFSREDRFLMLHDTMAAGNRFWIDFKAIDEASKSDKIKMVVDGNNIFIDSKFEYKYKARVMTMKNGYIWKDFIESYKKFVYEDGLLRVDNEDKNLYLSTDMQIVSIKDMAMNFNSIEDIEIELNKLRRYLWFALVYNFNCGVAYGAFLADIVYPALKDCQYDKLTCVKMELDENNPKNIKNLSKGRWRYVFEDKHEFHLNGRNDTDVLGDGKLRCVTYIHPLDIRKYLYFIDLSKETKHDFRN